MDADSFVGGSDHSTVWLGSVTHCVHVIAMHRTFERYLFLCRRWCGERQRQNHRRHRLVDIGSIYASLSRLLYVSFVSSFVLDKYAVETSG
jgi:hypothetical protein